MFQLCIDLVRNMRSVCRRMSHVKDLSCQDRGCPSCEDRDFPESHIFILPLDLTSIPVPIPDLRCSCHEPRKLVTLYRSHCTYHPAYWIALWDWLIALTSSEDFNDA